MDERLQIRLDHETKSELDSITKTEGYKSNSETLRNLIHERATRIQSEWELNEYVFNDEPRFSITCKSCGKYPIWANGISYIFPNYCPSCGAKMKQGGELIPLNSQLKTDLLIGKDVKRIDASIYFTTDEKNVTLLVNDTKDLENILTTEALDMVEFEWRLID